MKTWRRDDARGASENGTFHFYTLSSASYFILRVEEVGESHMISRNAQSLVGAARNFQESIQNGTV